MERRFRQSVILALAYLENCQVLRLITFLKNYKISMILLKMQKGRRGNKSLTILPSEIAIVNILLTRGPLHKDS